MLINFRRWGLGLSIEFNNPVFFRIWLGPVRMGLRFNFRSAR
jgi:hypothetical protein